MQSSGGVMTADDAKERPVFALESGPAAGVVAARGMGEQLGIDNLLAFDMGGTTAKASLIEDGAISRGREYEVGGSMSAGSRLIRGAGELLRIPTIDIAEVGAGGGSIAWLDPAGGLQVGPRSAGADPGPACYGRGGVEPTVTDANVVLGYMPAGTVADGQISISAELAEQAVRRVAEPLGLTLLEAASGIHRIANARMTRALRSVSSEKGRDPRDFALIAYGGAGPIHAAGLAEDLGMRTVLVPAVAGLFSAVGLLFARPGVPRGADVPPGRRRRRPGGGRSALRRDGGQARRARSQGAPRSSGRGRPTSATAARAGRSRSASRPARSTRLLAALRARFEDEHERLYGVKDQAGSPVEIRALRLAALGEAAATRSFQLDGANGATGSSRRIHVGGRRRRRAGADARRPSARRRSRARCSWTSTTPPSSSRPAGRSRRDAATGTLVLERGTMATKARVDPITLQIVGNALASMADEMATTICRTAHSTVVRDGMDFSAVVCDAKGRTVAQAVSVPFHLGSIPAAMETLLEHYGERIRPGDVFVMNDPFDGGMHLQDIFVFKPVHLDGELIGFTCTTAHHGDVGGRLPGSSACDNTEIFQEGIRLPWLRLYAEGEPVEDVFKIIEANVRIPRMTFGDLGAQVAACSVAERALVALAERHGRRRSPS